MKNGINADHYDFLKYKVKKLEVPLCCGIINGNAYRGNNNPNYTEDDFAL